MSRLSDWYCEDDESVFEIFIQSKDCQWSCIENHSKVRFLVVILAFQSWESEWRRDRETWEKDMRDLYSDRDEGSCEIFKGRSGSTLNQIQTLSGPCLGNCRHCHRILLRSYKRTLFFYQLPYRVIDGVALKSMIITTARQSKLITQAFTDMKGNIVDASCVGRKGFSPSLIEYDKNDA